MRGTILMVALLATALAAAPRQVRGDEMKLGAHQGSRDAAGLRVIDEKCLVCHNRERIEEVLKRRGNMAEIQRRMEAKGVSLSEAEKRVLSHFWRHNPYREKGSKDK